MKQTENHNKLIVSNFLSGKHVAIRPIYDADYVQLTQYLNDNDVTRYMFYGQTPMTEKAVREHFEEQMAKPHNTVFALVEKKSNELIGFVGLYEINATAQSAEFRILIGERSVWGRGYGTEATEMMLFYGFDRLNLHRIYLGVTSGNEGAIKTYEKAGFVLEGRLREDIYRNSTYYDSIKMGILRQEYYDKHYKSHKQIFGEKSK